MTAVQKWWRNCQVMWCHQLISEETVFDVLFTFEVCEQIKGSPVSFKILLSDVVEAPFLFLLVLASSPGVAVRAKNRRESGTEWERRKRCFVFYINLTTPPPSLRAQRSHSSMGMGSIPQLHGRRTQRSHNSMGTALKKGATPGDKAVLLQSWITQWTRVFIFFNNKANWVEGARNIVFKDSVSRFSPIVLLGENGRILLITFE